MSTTLATFHRSGDEPPVPGFRDRRSVRPHPPELRDASVLFRRAAGLILDVVARERDRVSPTDVRTLLQLADVALDVSDRTADGTFYGPGGLTPPPPSEV